MGRSRWIGEQVWAGGKVKLPAMKGGACGARAGQRRPKVRLFSSTGGVKYGGFMVSIKHLKETDLFKGLNSKQLQFLGKHLIEEDSPISSLVAEISD